MKAKYYPPALHEIILLANHLDRIGLSREASYLDSLLKKSSVDTDEDEDLDQDESYEIGVDDYIRNLCNINSKYQKRSSEASAHIKLFYDGDLKEGTEEYDRYKAMMIKSRSQLNHFRNQIFLMLEKASLEGISIEDVKLKCPDFLKDKQ